MKTLINTQKLLGYFPKKALSALQLGGKFLFKNRVPLFFIAVLCVLILSTNA